MIEIKDDLPSEELKEQIKAAIRKGEVSIAFEKADGSVREMRCTLNLDNLIKEEYHPKSEDRRKQNPEVQTVFDLDKNEWRSFRWDKLLSVNI